MLRSLVGSEMCIRDSICRIGFIPLEPHFHPASNFHRLVNTQFINTLPKFHGLESEDAYFFISEFEEVCLMMKIPNLIDDAIRLRFIPFALKD